MKSLLILITLLTGISAAAQDRSALRKKEYNLNGASVAIKGYDPVAYFTAGKAVKGDKNTSLYYEGVTYYFSSVANKDAFKANPSKYEPEYGGWCAYAMGNTGEKVEIDPATFKIVGGKLYLFYNKWLNNTLTDWNKDEAGLKAKADANWKQFYR
jgi:YHS domain-containing protein